MGIALAVISIYASLHQRWSHRYRAIQFFANTLKLSGTMFFFALLIGPQNLPENIMTGATYMLQLATTGGVILTLLCSQVASQASVSHQDLAFVIALLSRSADLTRSTATTLEWTYILPYGETPATFIFLTFLPATAAFFIAAQLPDLYLGKQQNAIMAPSHHPSFSSDRTHSLGARSDRSLLPDILTIKEWKQEHFEMILQEQSQIPRGTAPFWMQPFMNRAYQVSREHQPLLSVSNMEYVVRSSTDDMLHIFQLCEWDRKWSLTLLSASAFYLIAFRLTLRLQERISQLRMVVLRQVSVLSSRQAGLILPRTYMLCYVRIPTRRSV